MKQGAFMERLVDKTGELSLIAEDIGRHNAVDKVIGEALSTTGVDLQGDLLVVSSRISFDIVQSVESWSVGGCWRWRGKQFSS